MQREQWQVKRFTALGACLEACAGRDRVVNGSKLAEGRVDQVTDVVSEGDEVLVKCIDIDPSGRIRLSRKEAMQDAMAAAKAVFDPDSLFNPGKVLPDVEETS